MARRTQIDSAYRKITEQAVKASRQIRAEIRTREQELDQLRKQEQQISGLIGPVRGAARKRAAGRRINWRTVLEQLPKEFKASDVRKVRGLRGKASSEIFAGITRWIEAKAVKRKERGIYQRVG
jgi:septal ring factor EnvC (AmiA/AmiB activator)